MIEQEEKEWREREERVRLIVRSNNETSLNRDDRRMSVEFLQQAAVVMNSAYLFSSPCMFFSCCFAAPTSPRDDRWPLSRGQPLVFGTTSQRRRQRGLGQGRHEQVFEEQASVDEMGGLFWRWRHLWCIEEPEIDGEEKRCVENWVTKMAKQGEDT